MLVTIGPTKERFGIHRGLFCHESKFFGAALNGHSKEAIDGAIHFEDEDLEIFHCFNEWLYTRKLMPNDEDLLETKWQTLLKVYVFAEMRGTPCLQNDIVDDMISMKKQGLIFNETLGLSQAWDSTVDSSLLHSFLVDVFVRTLDLQDLLKADEENRKRLPIDFVLDLAVALEKLAYSHDHNFSEDLMVYGKIDVNITFMTINETRHAGVKKKRPAKVRPKCRKRMS